MNRAEALNQIRRILLLAAGRRARADDPGQLELPLLADLVPLEREAGVDPDLQQVGLDLHRFVLELLCLVQMESFGWVQSPLGRGRRRVGLGSVPPLRFLQEWSRAEPRPLLPALPPRSGTATPAEVELRERPRPSSRDTHFQECAARARGLADQLEIPFSLVQEVVRRLYQLIAQAVPEDDFPGLIHGHALRHRLVRTSRGKLTFQIDRDRSRGNGVFLTPPELVGELVGAIRRHQFDPFRAPGRVHVLDPACGSGSFLLAAARALVDEEALERDAGVLRRLRQVCGVDLDPQAVRIAAHNLTLWGLHRIRSHAGKELPGPLLDEVLEGECPNVFFDQVQAGNALLSEPSPFSPGFQWTRRFPGALERENPGFDVVLGNPPWISYGLRDRAAADEEQRRYYERAFPFSTQYKLTSYPLFVELALRLTRAGGFQGFLVPDSVLTGHHFSKIRQHLLDVADLYELSLVEAAPWPGAHVGYTVIYAARKKGAEAPPAHVCNRILAPVKPQRGRSRNRGIPPALLESLTRKVEEARAGQPRREETVVTEDPPPGGAALEGTQAWVPRSCYPPGRGPLRVFRDIEEMEFLERMQHAPIRFREVAWTYSGLIARYGQKSVQSRSAESSFVVRDRRGKEVFIDSEAAAFWCPALISGSEVTPYSVRWAGARIYIGERRDLPRIYKSGFDLDRYRRPKVFLRQTGDRLIAALDREGLYCMNNLHLLGGRSELRIPPLLLAGALMSEPVQRTYRIFALEGSRPLAQVDLKTVETLPYPVDGSGAPVGAGEPPPRAHPQARKMRKRIDRALAAADDARIVDLVGRASRLGDQPFEEGPLPGREVLTLTLLRILEGQETWNRARTGKPPVDGEDGGRESADRDLQELLDAVYTRLFEVAAEIRSGAERKEDGDDQDGDDQDGHDEDGDDRDGDDRDGHDRDGHNRDGHDQDGHDEDGHDEDGHDRDGHDERGRARDGRRDDGGVVLDSRTPRADPDANADTFHGGVP